MAEVSAETVEWLVDTVDARLQLITAYKHIGHSVPRLHAPVSRRGQDLVDDLLAAVEERGIPLAVGNDVRDLLVEDGAVRGALVDSGDGAVPIRARKTILAVNGFAREPGTRARFCPEIAGAQYFGARGSTGEAILWGEKLGAALANIAAYQGYAAVADPHGSLLSWTTIEKGGILVGADGRRFGDESIGYSGYARVVLAQGECLCGLRPADLRRRGAGRGVPRTAKYGGLKKADDAAELAAAFGLDGDALAQEIADFNAAADGGASIGSVARISGLGGSLRRSTSAASCPVCSTPRAACASTPTPAFCARAAAPFPTSSPVAARRPGSAVARARSAMPRATAC